MKLQEFLNKIVSEHGQGNVAARIGESDSTLSRFRSGQGGLTIGSLQLLLDSFDMQISKKDDQRKLEDALETMSGLWAKARNNGNGNY